MIKLKWPIIQHKSVIALAICVMLLWIPFLILLYPIATKLAFVVLEYNTTVNGRALVTKRKNDLKVNDKNAN